MAAPTKLIVGLGNPGDEYAATRHNVGWQVVDALASEAWSTDKRATAEVARHGSALLVKPQTFMNRSGTAVRALADYYGVAPADVLVVTDDADLPFGEIRVRDRGSSAGQRGLEDIITHLGTPDFPRVRVGIGRSNGDLTDHVLSRFGPEEETVLPEVLERARAAVTEWLGE